MSAGDVRPNFGGLVLLFVCYCFSLGEVHTLTGISLNGKWIAQRACWSFSLDSKVYLLGRAQTFLPQRKVEEGKNKMSVINAVRNKLISRVFACVKDQRCYEKIYKHALA
jgi:hypothetical protein